MALTEKQVGVLRKMIVGAAIVIAIIIFGSWYNPFNFSESFSKLDQLIIAIESALFPTIFLVIFMLICVICNLVWQKFS